MEERTRSTTPTTGWARRRSVDKAVYSYLIAFNSFMALGWTLVIGSILVSPLINGFLPALRLAFPQLGPLVVLLQSIVCMEVIHILLAWVPPSSMNPLLLLHCKVLRRLHMLVIAYYGVPQVHHTLAAGFVFVHWGAVDLIRYPFYLLNMLRVCPEFLRWLRYSEFIVLYPISFLSEMYLWWLMYPFIAEWSTESTSVPLSILAYVYSWLLIAYLIYRVVSFPLNYKRMLYLRLKKGLASE